MILSPQSTSDQSASARRWPSLALLLAAFLCGGASVAWAQAAFPLSSLVDPDVALYIEVAHPDQQWEAWERSELARRWKQTGLETLFAKTELVQHWRKIDQAVSQATPQTLTDHIRGLCGEGLSLAVYVPNQGTPQGLWISRARSAAVLEATLKAWDTLEPPFKTERRGPAVAEYFARRIKKDRQEQVLFYARRDDVLILSDQESLVAACSQRFTNRTASPEARAQQSPSRDFLTEADLVVPDTSKAAVWMYGNPRAWDRILNHEFDHSPGAELARSIWLSFRGIGAALRLDDGVTLTVAATLDSSRTNSGWRTAVEARDPYDPLGTPEQLAILNAAPVDAVAVAGGSMQPGWWLKQIQALQSERERADGKRLERVLRGAFGGLDPLSEVASALFRDWGVFVTRKAPPGLSKNPADWQLTTLHNLTSAADKRPELIAAIDDALGLGMQLLAAHANAENPDPTVIPVRTRGEGTIGRKMSGRGDWNFGYEIAGQRLWAGWPMEDVHRLVETRSPPTGSVPTELAELSRREFPKPALMAWVNLERLRAAIVPGSIPQEEGPERRLPLLLSQLVDRGFAAATLQPERIEFKLGGRFAP